MGYACGITRDARVAIHNYVLGARRALRAGNRDAAITAIEAMWALLPEGTYDNWDAVDDAAMVEGVLQGGEPLDEEEATEAGFDPSTEAGLLGYLAHALEELEADAADYDAAETYCSIIDS